ncbi:MAG TPA: tRNA (guanosine(37)-N1)-methyltransferase TrmD [Rhizomicrobium sp.]|nr:tRNA (guanosine(37)-N1)-methyltransferase TrmD [Rhizomicrobium sp.]
MSNTTWQATVLTLFPEMFPGPLGVSLLGKALANDLWRLQVRDVREHGLGKHRQVDDTPAGGGPGMVMRADVAAAAIDAVARDDRALIYPSPRGPRLTQAKVRALAEGSGVIILCGRFEGIDNRVLAARDVVEVSLGDFVLAGGEIAAMALIEACVRLLPGVLGDAASPEEESFAHGLLEYPHFTRPQQFEGVPIPDVLTSGNHLEISKWRQVQAEALTRAVRPDLWSLYEKRKG